MTIEEIAHKWAINNKDGFPVDLKYIEYFYLKGLRRGLTLSRQEIQKRMLALEEPVSESIDFEQELYKAFGQIKDFTLGIAIAKRFYDMGRKHKEPVSEELIDVAKQYVKDHVIGIDKVTFSIATDMFISGAKWQKEQFEKNRLKHCKSITNEQAELEQGFIDQHIDKYNRMPTFLDAIEYGMRLQKEQMMAKAIDGITRPDDGEIWCNLKSFNFKDGDKCKVILIKED